jgi:hypothetical protein
MPFSNKTKRQRCEKGQVVPEYKTIMARAPKNQKEWEALRHSHSENANPTGKAGPVL